ncbi:MAG TPA: HD domain-containing protein [Planctomycetota bacterium]|jgi:putative nucleotidyltransferase with HDIG domain|nr:HD domain-containing protein [Planctomycetota bacterium]
MTTTADIERIWPELSWIEDADLRARTTRCWELAFAESPLTPEDLERMPFTLHVPNCPTTFMEHKRLVVHIARSSAESIGEFMPTSLPVDRDTLLAGAILADVGKLLEYESRDGECRQSNRGKYLRHPFTGVALARAAGLPDAVCHIIATHAGEGNLVARSNEAWIVHHADFMTYEPLVKGLKLDG